MNATSYARLAGVIFAMVAILQLVRAVSGWPVTVAGAEISVSASWVASVVAGVLALLGFTSRA
jgi:hypothetical protein